MMSNDHLKEGFHGSFTGEFASAPGPPPWGQMHPAVPSQQFMHPGDHRVWNVQQQHHHGPGQISQSVPFQGVNPRMQFPPGTGARPQMFPGHQGQSQTVHSKGFVDPKKDHQFHVQQEKLKLFGKSKNVKTLNPDDLINSMLKPTNPENGKTNPHHHQAVFGAKPSVQKTNKTEDDFGDFVFASNSPQSGSYSDQASGFSQSSASSSTHGLSHRVTVTSVPGFNPEIAASSLNTPMTRNVEHFTNTNQSVLQHHSLPASSTHYPHHSTPAPNGVLAAVVSKRAPPWLMDLNHSPPLYRDLAASVCLNGVSPDPVKAFEVFASTGVPGPVLSQIWSTVHPNLDDSSFEVAEFVAVLAMIAMAQKEKDYSKLNLEAILCLRIPPLPHFAAQNEEMKTKSCKTETAQPDSPELKINFGFSPPVFEKVKFPPKMEEAKVESAPPDDDFGDFQSVDLFAVGNEDKYAALRSLTEVTEVDETDKHLTPLDEPIIEKEPNTPDSIPSLPEVPSLETLSVSSSSTLVKTETKFKYNVPTGDLRDSKVTNSWRTSEATTDMFGSTSEKSQPLEAKSAIFPHDIFSSRLPEVVEAKNAQNIPSLAADIFSSISESTDASKSSLNHPMAFTSLKPAFVPKTTNIDDLMEASLAPVGIERQKKISSSSNQDDDFGDFVSVAGENEVKTGLDESFGEFQEGKFVGFQEETKFGGIQDETKSVASLDFSSTPSLGAVVGNGDGDSDSNWFVDSFGGSESNNSGFGNDGDKYSAFRDLGVGGAGMGPEAVEKELLKIWKVGGEAFQELEEILGDAEEEESLSAFMEHPKGLDYVFCVLEIFAVGARAHWSFQEAFPEISKPCDVWQKFLSAFNNVLPMIKRGNRRLFGDLTIERLTRELASNGKLKCGVCLSTLNSTSLATSPQTTDEFSLNAQTLQWGGAHYHVSCSNLWLNKVHSVLPALTV